MKEETMKYRAVRQPQLFGILKDQNEAALLPPPVQSKLIVLLAQLMTSVINAIERGGER
jgi:hypothetical protein